MRWEGSSRACSAKAQRQPSELVRSERVRIGLHSVLDMWQIHEYIAATSHLVHRAIPLAPYQIALHTIVGQMPIDDDYLASP